MKLRRRWKVFWNLAVIFTIIVVVRRWDPPFDDSDMWVTRVEVPAEQNAFLDYVRIGEELEARDRRVWRLQDILNDAAKGWPVVHELAESNRTVMVELERLQAKPGCRAPEMRSPDDRTYKPMGLVRLAMMLEISAASAQRKGEVREATRNILTGIQLARHFSMEPAELMQYSIALAAHETSMRAIRRLAGDPAVDETALRNILAGLRGQPLGNDSQPIALRGEHKLVLLCLSEAERNGNISFNSLDPIFIYETTNRSLLAHFRNQIAVRTGYLPNRTRERLHNLLEPQLRTACMHATHPDVAIFWRSVDEMDERQHSPRHLLRPNFAGESLISADVYAGSANSSRITQNTIELTRTVVAIRLFQLAHGRNPETLQELCPAFIDAVPLDRYDGAPIRYEHATATVFSAWPLNYDGQPVRDGALLTSKPLVKPSGPNEKTAFVLPQVLVTERPPPQDNSGATNRVE